MKMHFVNTHNYSFRFLSLVVALSGSLFFAQAAQAAAVGKVVFATGSPEASDSSGTSRVLRRGGEVFSGDKLTTAARSRLQISFIDGAYISLQPNSQYEIEEYNFSGTQDGTEKANYHLLKGGVRAVTGLIGKKNNDAYKVRTAVATIGIRGTGHNTRICAGDCGTQKDGLYHNTWEGITTVENDVDKTEVPAGQGVYVEDLESPIVSLDQPSAVTAVESTKEKQEEREEEEESATLVSTGEQRTGDDGLQVVVVEDDEVRGAIGRPDPTFSEVISGQVLQAVAPDVDDPDSVDAPLVSALSVFKNADGKPVGFLGLERDHDDNGNDIRIFATTDLAAVLGGDDATAVAEVESLLDLVTGDELVKFQENPASVAEFNTVGNGTIGLGRWADGRVFSIDAEGDAGLDDLVNNQSIHFVYGPEPATLTTSGTATYNLIGSTDSTSVNGSSIGNGVTAGFLAFDFATSEGFVSLDVNHSGTNYLVRGELDIFATEKSFGDSTDGAVKAFTNAAGSACNPSCNTFVEGTFFAPEVNTFPQFAGLEYDIQDTDVVTGVAAFEINNPAAPLSTTLSGQTVLSISHDDDPMDIVDSGGLFNVSLFLNGSNQPIGLLGTESDFNGMTTENFRVFAVTDVAAALTSDNANLSAEALSLLNENTVQGFDNPAQILEFMNIGTVSFARIGNGNLLFSDINLTNPGVDQESGIDPFVNNQSLHIIYGPEPGPIPTSGMGIYSFLTMGGTQSTSVSGATIGNGITGGSIFVDFSTSSASLGMNVDHNGDTYSVSGALMIDGNTLFDASPTSVTAMNITAMSGACYPSCPTFIDANFAGPTNGSSQPSHILLGYDIRETDPIIGVGVFGNP